MLNVSFWNLAITIVNLLVLYVAMRIFLFKPVQKIIAERQAEADRQFEEAAESKSKAEEMKAQYEQSLAAAEDEKKKVLKEARKSADKEYHRIIKDAEKAAIQVKQDAVTEAENRKAEIIKKVEKEIADMVVGAAEKVVGEKGGAETDNALYNKFLDKAGDES